MVNRVILIGNLGKDPEVKTLNSGQQVATFSLATSESWKGNNGEWQTKTEWHNVVAWGNTAKAVERILRKGSMAYIEGKNQTRSWEKDGQTYYRTEVVANTVRSLSKREEREQPTTADVPAHDEPELIPADGEDLPF